MKLKLLALLLTAATSLAVLAQPAIPNLGDKQCSLWTAVTDKAKSDLDYRDQVVMMDWWALGYLKGMATQFSYSEQTPSPLLKLRRGEELEWMKAYCRVNARSLISDSALALLKELMSRK
jgi:hypothetical protein